MLNELEFNKTRYTHRDYESLRRDLIAIIPSLTQKWTSTEESDPGIVLIKLIAMLGDNLSYNIDKMALETYIESVTQRKNCRKILALLGYKMHWYRSAKVTATVRNMITTTNFNDDQVGTVIKLTPWESTFKAGNLIYVMVSEEDEDTKVLNLPPSSGPRSIKLVEGVINVARFTATSLRNNRYYFNRQNIDEAHLRLLIDQNGNLEEVGTLVDNLFLVGENDSVYFEFNIDEYGMPYIQLADFWKSQVGEDATFVVQYLVSSGSLGNVSDNAFEMVPYENGSQLYISNLANNTETALDPYNSPGYDPENCNEARKSSANWVFTYDTLVSASDFEKAGKRTSGIYNAKLVDGEIIKLDDLVLQEILNRKDDDTYFKDYLVEETVEGVVHYRMTPYIVILYLIHQAFTQNAYCNSSSDADNDAWFSNPDNAEGYLQYEYNETTETWDYTGQKYFPYKPSDLVITEVDDALDDNKIMNVELHYGTTKVFPFKVAGTLHFVEPIDPTTMIYIIDVLITDALRLYFRPDNRKYGQKPNFIEIVDVIHKADSRIHYFDAEESLLEWVLGQNPQFDTTSFAKFQGLSAENFNVYSRFLRFQLTNLTNQTIPLDAPVGAEGCESIDDSLNPEETKFVKCTDIAQVRTLKFYIEAGIIAYNPEGGVH